ncbi:MAG: flagellar basal body P-ring protein FlgI [Planctomycetota bacterium]
MIALAAVLLLIPGCNRDKREAPLGPRQADTSNLVVRDIPAPLRGTIGAEASIRGVQSTLVSGIGFVVGLNGTGGLTMPEQYAAHLEREMGLNGINVSNQGSGSAIDGRSPRQLLRDPNTAAVIVQAAIPPGANTGETFDVYVRAINATSLEGGQLWTTELRVGSPSSFGDRQALILARARGPIFLNPFAEPGSDASGVRKTVGRVLDGGQVSTPTLIEIILDNPSHQRARQIASAVNSAFPSGPGDIDQTARGRDETLVQVRIPLRYVERREDFIELIRHLPIDQSFPETYARRFATTLQNEPYLSRQMSWGLESIGERSKPFLAELYESGEAVPRLSALRAGARLNDTRAVGALRDISLEGQQALRTDAIRLLAEIDAGPIIDDTLLGLLEAPELSIRVEAYEGLIDRAIKSQRRRLTLARARAWQERRLDEAISLSQIDAFAQAYVPPGTLFGVSRELVEGKFFLDRVPFGDPLIYITQQGEPRIVVFGEDPSLTTPMLVNAWSDRLLLASDEPEDPVRLYYRDDTNRRTVTIDEVPGDLVGFIKFLAQRPTPEDPRPGLGLGYAEVVGVLYELQADRGTAAAFATENDRLLAELLESVEPEQIEIRPETPGGEITLVAADDPRREVVEREESGLVRERRSLLVPINPPEDETDE